MNIDTVVTFKEQYVLENIAGLGKVGTTYEDLKNHGMTLKPKSYVGVINSLKKKGLVNVNGVGIKGTVVLV